MPCILSALALLHLTVHPFHPLHRLILLLRTRIGLLGGYR
jgi:hypothetical protein